MKIFFSVGEPSGDVHAANLIRELRRQHPDLEAVGYGGPEMAAAGCQLHADLTALAVMWFLRVLLNLHKFLDLASRADRYFRHRVPTRWCWSITRASIGGSLAGRRLTGFRSFITYRRRFGPGQAGG